MMILYDNISVFSSLCWLNCSVFECSEELSLSAARNDLNGSRLVESWAAKIWEPASAEAALRGVLTTGPGWWAVAVTKSEINLQHMVRTCKNYGLQQYDVKFT